MYLQYLKKARTRFEKEKSISKFAESFDVFFFFKFNLNLGAVVFGRSKHVIEEKSLNLLQIL